MDPLVSTHTHSVYQVQLAMQIALTYAGSDPGVSSSQEQEAGWPGTVISTRVQYSVLLLKRHPGVGNSALSLEHHFTLLRGQNLLHVRRFENSQNL